MGQTRDNTTEKNRIRDEIDEQIRYYLQRGGKIDVLSADRAKSGKAIASSTYGG